MSMKGLFFVCMAAVAASPVFGASLLYQGHGSVRIEAADGMVIYVDPYAGESPDMNNQTRQQAPLDPLAFLNDENEGGNQNG